MSAAWMNREEKAVLENAIQQLQDCLLFARGEGPDPEACGVTPVIQADLTRETMRAAQHTVSRWRAREVGKENRFQARKRGDR